MMTDSAIHSAARTILASPRAIYRAFLNPEIIASSRPPRRIKDYLPAKAVAQSAPENIITALPKAQRKGRTFVDYHCKRRSATAVMLYSARARSGAPITWNEMEAADMVAQWHVGEATDLVKRVTLKALAGWGRANQALSHL